MPRGSATNIIDILVSQNIIDDAKVSNAKKESLASGLPLEQILLNRNWITKLDIVKAKSVLYGVPYIDITEISIPQELANLTGEEESVRAKLIIFEKGNNLYKAAMANPLDIQSIRFFEQKLRARIQVYIAVEEDVISKIKASSSGNFGSEVSNVIEQAVSSSEYVDISDTGNQDIATIDISTAPVAKIVNIMLESAIVEKASDIHIEPQDKRVRVRYRINGILREKLTLPTQIAPSLISRIKILSKMQIDEKRKPLDGRFQVKSGDQEIDLRVSSLPTVLGEKVVIRLLRKDLGIMSLEDTGMRGNALKTFTEGLKATAGIILVTGPTGSGKTVTVATSMNILNKPEVNVVSIEDPVEIKVPGVNQVQVNVDAGLTFASALRAFLRQDPNIISVGEIRDEETAQLAAQASLTGHLVISTLHTNSAAGALPRLLDMGVEPYIIASTVDICAAQRLCRRVCPYCKEAYIPTEPELVELKRILGDTQTFNEKKFAEFQQKFVLKQGKLLNLAAIEKDAGAKLFLFKGKGCDRCQGTGYQGRVGIFEVFKVTDKIGSLVMQHSSSDDIERQAMSEGMIRMIQDGYFKCLEGMTTVEEVQRVIHT
jgi:type IV pilus assembly protein PilB